jgi:ORF6N domain
VTTSGTQRFENLRVNLVRRDAVESRILTIRGQRVMLDTDLAELYGVATKALNQQVMRNIRRFPADFMFRLTRDEKDLVITDNSRLSRLKFSPHLPYAFMEHGALMLASVLNSSTAIGTSIEVVRAFVRLRELLSAHRELGRRLDLLERKYDGQFKVVFEAIRELMQPVREPRRRRIGFRGASG